MRNVFVFVYSAHELECDYKPVHCPNNPECPVMLKKVSLHILSFVFTAQCTLVHMRGLGIACRPSVRPSVCNVGGL